MQVLSSIQIQSVYAGLSDQTMICVRVSMLGGTEGAVLGGLLSMPFCTLAMGQELSGLAIFCVAAGVGMGSVLGGAIGLCTGYSICYWWGDAVL